MNLTIEFQENDQIFDADFENDAEITADFGELHVVGSGGGGGEGTTDHKQLTNRDAADQHPMSAITGLVKALGDKQPVGNYLTKESDPTVPAWAKQSTKPKYTASEVGALPVGTKIPSKTSDLTNDSGFITGFTETDPTVPNWAKQESKPTYSADEVGADPVGSASTALKSAQEYTDKQIAAIPTPDVSGQISTHNVAVDSHNDIRLLISGLTQRINALADSDDTTLDQMSEVVAYIKDNRELIETVTTAKVNVADIIDNLTTNVSDRPLSAAQGVVLKQLVDGLNTAVGGKLDASALTDAVNMALAQAKESGEFDGAPGYTPQKGVDYFDGTDGTPGLVQSETEPSAYDDGTYPAWLNPAGGQIVNLVEQSELEAALPKPLDLAITPNTFGANDYVSATKYGGVIEATICLTTPEEGNVLGAAVFPYPPTHISRSFLANASGGLCRIILRPTGILEMYPVTQGRAQYYGQIVYITNE